MKKSIIAVSVIVLVAVGLVAPAGYFGEATERILRERVANMPYGIEVEIAEYERGWFSSTARLEWDLLGEAIPPEALEEVSASGLPPMLTTLMSGPIAADLEIAHGPVFFAVGLGAGLFSARGRIALGAGAPDAPSNDIEVLLRSFSGQTVHNRIKAPRLSLNLGEVSEGSRGTGVAVELDGVSLELEDLLMEGEWAGPGSFQLQNAALGSLEIIAADEGESMRLGLTDLEQSTEFPKGIEEGALIMDSNSVYSVGELRLESTGGDTMLHMAGGESQSATALTDEGVFVAESSASFNVLDILGHEFAPARLEASVGGLSEEAILMLADEFVRVSEAAEDGGAAGGPAAGIDENGQPTLVAGLAQPTPELLEALHLLLAGSPHFNLDATLTYGGEHPLAFTLQQTFDGERLPATAADLNIESFLAGADLFVSIEMPIVAARELAGEQLLDMGLSQGLLQEQRENYVFIASLRNGELELNGNTVPMPLGPASPPPGEADSFSPFGDPGESPFEFEGPSPFDDPGPSPVEEAAADSSD